VSSKIIEKDWRKELKLLNKKVLLYVGVLEQRRNPLFLLNVLSTLPDDYVLLMVGDGPLLSIVKETMSAKGLEDKCILLGRLPQEYLPSIYKSSDLFLLASDYEIYGMVILEAMYFGLPVISTLTAGSETLIESYENGIIINNKDEKEWGQTIISVMNDKSLQYKMKEKSEKKVKDGIIWDKACERFIRLYYSVK
jgi:glycosyltransferase involved in cell wall biosynthesis